MEKVPPPPYQENMYPQPGFQPPSQPQAYPPPMNQPQPYPQPMNQPQSYPQPMNQIPMQPGYPQPQVVTVTSPVMFGPNSIPTTCPYCHSQITTRVQSESSSKTHLFAVLLCLIGCIPCCLIPYCSDSCQNQNHYCPSCQAFLGSYTN